MSEPWLEPAAFRTWLRSLEPNASCGMRKSCLHCPLANYLEATTGLLYTVSDVYAPYEWPYDTVPEKDVPPWAMHFIEQIDFGPLHEPVPAREALAALEVVCEH
jgi:hypothetical protein